MLTDDELILRYVESVEVLEEGMTVYINREHINSNTDLVTFWHTLLSEGTVNGIIKKIRWII